MFFLYSSHQSCVPPQRAVGPGHPLASQGLLAVFTAGVPLVVIRAGLCPLSAESCVQVIWSIQVSPGPGIC